jgi:hypothetical protein
MRGARGSQADAGRCLREATVAIGLARQQAILSAADGCPRRECQEYGDALYLCSVSQFFPHARTIAVRFGFLFATEAPFAEIVCDPHPLQTLAQLNVSSLLAYCHLTVGESSQ